MGVKQTLNIFIDQQNLISQVMKHFQVRIQSRENSDWSTHRNVKIAVNSY